MQLEAMSTNRMADMADTIQNRSMSDITCHLSDVRVAVMADILQNRSMSDVTCGPLYVRYTFSPSTYQT